MSIVLLLIVGAVFCALVIRWIFKGPAANTDKRQLTVMTNAEVVCVDGIDSVEAVVIRHRRTGRLRAVNASECLSCDDQRVGTCRMTTVAACRRRSLISQLGGRIPRPHVHMARSVGKDASVACASAEGVWHPTIAGASWTSPSFPRAATMKRAKSTRRVMLLARIGSPTCRLQTGKSWLSPSSRSLPLTTVHLVLLANTHRQASTWSSRSTTRARRASRPTTCTSSLIFHEYHVLAIACDVPPAREHEARPWTCVVENSLRCS